MLLAREDFPLQNQRIFPRCQLSRHGRKKLRKIPVLQVQNKQVDGRKTGQKTHMSIVKPWSYLKRNWNVLRETLSMGFATILTIITESPCICNLRATIFQDATATADPYLGQKIPILEIKLLHIKVRVTLFHQGKKIHGSHIIIRKIFKQFSKLQESPGNLFPWEEIRGRNLPWKAFVSIPSSVIRHLHFLTVLSFTNFTYEKKTFAQLVMGFEKEERHDKQNDLEIFWHRKTKQKIWWENVVEARLIHNLHDLTQKAWETMYDMSVENDRTYNSCKPHLRLKFVMR